MKIAGGEEGKEGGEEGSGRGGRGSQNVSLSNLCSGKGGKVGRRRGGGIKGGAGLLFPALKIWSIPFFLILLFFFC